MKLTSKSCQIEKEHRVAFECSALHSGRGVRAERCVERSSEPAWPASHSAELGEVKAGHAPRMRMLGGTAHRDGRQTAADTLRGVARLRRSRRAPVSHPFSRARWRASVVVASSRSRPGNGGESRYARSSRLVDSHPFDVSPPPSPPPSLPSSSSSLPPLRRLDNGRAASRVVGYHRGRPRIVLAAPVGT